ncbi:hypothetical protein L208DRAFT_1404410 [Tricholoma matsutake]|nr:hypothetical protein L208DRAFT_1404410 [Tricholoma matsutake 945]
MATSSTALAQSTVNLFTVEHATSILTVQLALEETDNHGNGGNAEALISDMEFALRTQAEDLVNAVQVVEDAQFARELEVGFPANHQSFVVNPPSAAHHREIALSVLKRSGLLDVQLNEPSIFPDNLGKTLDTGTTEADVDSDTTQHAESIRCVVCEDPMSDSEACLQAPCNHYYCGDCIANLVNACTSDELLYPPKCCNQPIPDDAIIPFLDDSLQSDYCSKQREFAVPATQRIYCPTPDCPAFIASSESVSGDVTCYRCRSRVCSMCKQIAHTGDCLNDPGILQVRALARVHRWQTCPNCYAIIEQYGGCKHMTCRCNSQFCYHCGRRWPSCRC